VNIDNLHVVIIDSGGANIASVVAAVERLGAAASLSSDVDEIRAASHVILPGVGAAANAMAHLRERGLDSVIPTLRRPLLGICLGMQLLCEGSEEGDTPCLGVMPGWVRRLPDHAVSVPHMGWNRVSHTQTIDPLFDGVADGAHLYFVHSFALAPTPYTTALATHGQRFAAAIRRDNFMGVQFHPERSSLVGQRILSNFLNMP
jgi:glutamine amidotransferase